MALAPVSRTSLPDEVFGQLVDGILGGELVVGEALPSERALAETLGVSRPAVREALQRLAQSRLVAIRQGESTTVRDWTTSAGLDLLPHLLVAGGKLDPTVIESIIEVRQLVGPLVAGHAAERRDDGDVARLREILDELTTATDDTARQQIALRFWDQVVIAARSIALRLLFNALRDAYEPLLEATGPLLHDEVTHIAGYRAIVDAIAAGNADASRVAASELLARGSRAVEELLSRLDAE
ncbi:MAG: FadR/GntR family transcriptional regulator [Nitriliruptorales bacterium]|nr:FadR/GntR family transcriptional regulator [Nitriliruptorales bacterium]